MATKDEALEQLLAGIKSTATEATDSDNGSSGCLQFAQAARELAETYKLVSLSVAPGGVRPATSPSSASHAF